MAASTPVIASATVAAVRAREVIRTPAETGVARRRLRIPDSRCVVTETPRLLTAAWITPSAMIPGTEYTDVWITPPVTGTVLSRNTVAKMGRDVTGSARVKYLACRCGRRPAGRSGTGGRRAQWACGGPPCGRTLRGGAARGPRAGCGGAVCGLAVPG